jgi:hypothetical protein
VKTGVWRIKKKKLLRQLRITSSWNRTLQLIPHEAAQLPTEEGVHTALGPGPGLLWGNPSPRSVFTSQESLQTHTCHPRTRQGEACTVLPRPCQEVSLWGCLPATCSHTFLTQKQRKKPQTDRTSFPLLGKNIDQVHFTPKSWFMWQEVLWHLLQASSATVHVTCPGSGSCGDFSAQSLNQSSTNCFFEKRCLLNNFNCHKND